MTLHQLHLIKLWQIDHRPGHPVEFHAWDAVLTAWLIGWVGLPAAALLWQPLGVLACTLLFFAPTLYVRGRQHLHRAGRLRCDWLTSANETAPHKT